MEETATLEKKVFLIERVGIQGPEHKIPIPKRATKLGWKGGYALFYDGIPNGYNEKKGKLEDILPDKVCVQFPDYSTYSNSHDRFITYGKPVFYY